jgi:hypothetical protein
VATTTSVKMRRQSQVRGQPFVFRFEHGRSASRQVCCFGNTISTVKVPTEDAPRFLAKRAGDYRSIEVVFSSR